MEVERELENALEAGSWTRLEHALTRVAAAQGRELSTAVASLVAEGTCDRRRLLDACLHALTLQETPASQKGVAQVLKGLTVDSHDLEDRVGLWLGLMVTSRGPVTAALLPPFLNAITSGDDLVELAGTILARREKAQKATLLRALVRDDAVDRWGRDGVLAALRLVADLPDEALSSRARAALDRLGIEAGPGAHDAGLHHLWTTPAPHPGARRTEALDDDDAALTAAVSVSLEGGRSVVDDALLLDALVRRAARDLTGLDRWLSRTGESGRWEVPVPVLALAGHARATEEAHVRACELTVLYQDGQEHPGTEYWSVTSQPVTHALATLHHGEVALRLGTLPFLVSTPTHDDGSLDLDALADRLRRYGDAGVGPLDLFLALLRLAPVPVSRADELDGIGAPLWVAARPRRGLARLLGRRHPATLDAGDVVRAWVARGGLPALTARRTEGGIAIDPVTLPVPLQAFMGAPPGLTAGHAPGVRDFLYRNVVGATTVGVVPWWPDFVAAKAMGCFDQYSRNLAPRLLPALVAAPGPAGLPVHQVVAATLSHADEDHRLVGAEAALALMSRGKWDPALFTDACLALLGRGELRLARTASGWEAVVLRDGMQELWPAVRDAVDAACALPRRPSGLADLLAFYGRYAAVEPDARPPEALVALATSRGTSRAHVEARAAVAALGVAPETAAPS